MNNSWLSWVGSPCFWETSDMVRISSKLAWEVGCDDIKKKMNGDTRRV